MVFFSCTLASPLAFLGSTPSHNSTSKQLGPHPERKNRQLKRLFAVDKFVQTLLCTPTPFFTLGGLPAYSNSRFLLYSSAGREGVFMFWSPSSSLSFFSLFSFFFVHSCDEFGPVPGGLICIYTYLYLVHGTTEYVSRFY